ncbi:glycosyltransferase family 4 protein [Mesobacillus subterraneus]|uniref:glycosyltransferase family 4 protein n=1 Tax=Mesobacillus subterraneus TaxID=285983 RepID=UPI00273E4754|nr:glycosyltransferase family 4 protein [Mesobacillus subterraneus]WLR55465.1 glycosyltransferase family 4 protein [Mesobacillus subterraneus]
MEGKELMKRIIVINHYGVTPNMPGPSKNYEMAKFFAGKYNCNSEFWICGYSHYIGKMDKSIGKFNLQAREQIDDFSVIRIKSTPYKKNPFLRQLNITVFDLISSVKILFSKDIDYIVITIPPVTIFSVLAAKLRRIKLIADVEDLWLLFLEDMGMRNKLAIKYMNFSADYLYKSADGIAAVSKGMLNFVKQKVNKKPLWISPLGVNTKDYFNKTPDYSLIESKEWKDDFKIMYLGVHGKANDLYSVLNTISSFNKNFKNKLTKKVSFVFIGDGEEKANLINLAKQLDLGNVYFEDPVPGKLVPDFLIHADICLTNLMKIESFKLVRPNKLFQYMALGKPIISGIWGEFQEIIEEVGSGSYIDFTKYDEASHMIYELCSDAELLETMGTKGIEYIKHYGDREKIFSNFYNHLIEDVK